MFFVGTGDYDRAIQDLSKAVALAPSEVDPVGLKALFLYYFGRAVAWTEMGRHDRALKDLDEAIARIAREPNVWRLLAYRRRGDAYAAMGQDERAIEEYDKVIIADQGAVHPHPRPLQLEQVLQAQVLQTAHLHRGLAFDRKGDKE